MSVDTKKMREWAQGCAITGWVTNVSLMCDEIDRLRAQNIEVLDELKISEALRKDLEDQLRPRSIKDEPPPRSEYVLACAKNTAVWLDYWNPGDGFEWWLPMPSAPPQPDAFEEWAKAQPWWDALGGLAQAYMQDCWRAALASVKKG